MLPNTSPEQGKDLDNELQNEAEPGSAVREKLKVSQSQPYLQGRFSINQVRLDKLDNYNKASQDQIAQVPKLLKTFEQKVSRANQNKEMWEAASQPTTSVAAVLPRCQASTSDWATSVGD